MNSIRKYWWTALTLTAFAGCGTEDTTAPPPAGQSATPGPAAGGPPSTGSPGSPVPTVTPTAAPGATKPGAKADTPGGPPPVVEAPNKADDKKDAPKGDDKKDAPKGDDKKDTPKTKEADKKAASIKLSDTEIAAIKKLPEAEQAVALKQLVCPSSNEPLGSMGTPVKITAGGKTFFLCCKGCEKDVKSNVKEVLARLKD